MQLQTLVEGCRQKLFKESNHYNTLNINYQELEVNPRMFQKYIDEAIVKLQNLESSVLLLIFRWNKLLKSEIINFDSYHNVICSLSKYQSQTIHHSPLNYKSLTIQLFIINHSTITHKVITLINQSAHSWEQFSSIFTSLYPGWCSSCPESHTPLAHSSHLQLSPHRRPELKHSQYFFWH